jgi:M6 family metalloprotease-like protein
MAADNAGVDFTKYDNDGPDGVPNSADDDGRVDHILIIYSGNGQNHYGRDAIEGPGPDDNGGANDYGRDLIWPSRVAFNFGTYDGKNVFTATVNPEDPNFDIPVGVTCHEFGHDLGLPDLYNVSSGASVVGNWAVMDLGNYNTNATGVPRPAHMSAWSKMQLGWIEPIVINETNNNQGVHQVNQTTSQTNDSVCYLAEIDGENEYYLVENRNKTIGTFDEALPNRGILIWHIDDDMLANINKVTLPTYPYYTVILENYKNDADIDNYLLNKNTANWISSGAADQADFNVSTAPNSSANGGMPSTIYIDRIQDNALWNMTFRILVKADANPPGEPQNVQVYDSEYDNGEIVNLTWDASADDGSAADDVLYYNIYMNGSAGFGAPKIMVKSIDAIDSASYQTQITGLTDGVMYNFTILADDGPNVSPFPGNFSVIPLDNIARVPRNPGASDTLLDDGENITISWFLSEDDPIGNATGPSDILWYNISMNDTGQGAGGAKHLIATIGPGNASYQVGNLTNNVPYYFLITSVDDVFNKGISLEVSATPIDNVVGTPQSLQVIPGSWSNNTNFVLNWINPTENSGVVEAFYKIDSAPTNSNDFSINATGLGINAMIISGPLTDGIHPVYVWLRDGENNSDYSTAVMVNVYSDRTPPGTPIGLSATPTGWSPGNAFTLDWTNPFDTSGIAGAFFKIDSPPNSYNDGIYVPGPNRNDLVGISVPGEGEHTIYVWLGDNAINTDHTTNASIKIYYDRTNPGAPLDITSIPDTWTNINSYEVTWNNPTELSGIVGVRYKVDIFPTSDTDGTYVPGIDITSIQNIRVSYSGTHVVYVWLVDNATNVNYMNWNTTYVKFDNNPPAQPINLVTDPGGWSKSNSFNLTWTNQWDHSGIEGVYYKINSPPNNNTDGVYVAGSNIQELNNISMPKNGTNQVYIWLKDIAGNTNYMNYSYFLVHYDHLAPGAPEAIIPYPTNVWTSNNSFMVAWELPDEHSGIGGAFYKLDSPPTYNTDGIYIDKININYIDELTVIGSGAHDIYIWLSDRLGNINYQNYSSTQLLFDELPPGQPINLTVTPSTWSGENKFNVTWENPYDHSGIYGLYYRFSAPTENLGKLMVQQDITNLTDITIPSQGEYTIFIWLIDNAYNMDYTRNSTQMLRFDLQTPDIIHSRVSYATKGVPITITAIVKDDLSGVNEVKLFYKHNSDSQYLEKKMSNTGNIFSAEIPAAFVSNETIGYFIYASDSIDDPNFIYYGKHGQVSSRPGTTTDIDITTTEADVVPPIIVHEKVKAGIAGATLAMTASVTDDGSGVSEVWVLYRTKGTTTFIEGRMTSANPYYFELPGHAVTTAGVEYFLYAVDNSPRVNEVFFGNYGLTTIRPSAPDTYINIEVTAQDDTAPKIIYGPDVRKISSTTAVVFWITDEPADSEIDYGTTINLTSQAFNDSFMTIHSFMLTDLMPDTLYYYCVFSTDRNNNGPTKSEILTFKTTKTGEEDSDGDGIPDNVDTDDDNDDIPDAWEISHGLDPNNNMDADLDNDNDGFSNLREYLADSDPKDSESTPLSVFDTYSPIIDHEAITKVDQYHKITFSAIVVDNGSGIKYVKLYYKYKSDSEYKSINMSKTGDRIYAYEFSGSEVSSDIGYYLEAADFAMDPNMIFYGKEGMTETKPTSDTDINLRVIGRTGDDDPSDGEFLEDLYRPFGIDNLFVCLIVLIIGIILLVAFVLVVRNTIRAQAIAKRSMRYKSTTADGDALIWEGEELEELDEVEDLKPTGRVKKDDFEGL